MDKIVSCSIQILTDNLKIIPKVVLEPDAKSRYIISVVQFKINVVSPQGKAEGLRLEHLFYLLFL